MAVDRNVTRDALARSRLRRKGWTTLVIWECQLKDSNRLVKRLSKFLGRDNDSS